MVLRRISTCCGRLPRAKWGYLAKWRTASQIAEWPLVFHSTVEVEQRTHSEDEIVLNTDTIQYIIYFRVEN